MKGAYPVDYGWGTAHFGVDQANLEQYREVELVHARCALLGILGSLTPEILAKFTGSQFSGPAWFQAAAQLFQEGSLSYASNSSLTHATSVFAILACQVMLKAAAEAYGANQAGPTSKDPLLLPGGTFNPLGFADDPDSLAQFKVKEVKNKRLAMVCVLGFFVQAAVTSGGPVGSWTAHVADTFGSYSLSLALMDQVAASPAAMLAACDRVFEYLTAWYGPERNEWLSPSPDARTLYYLTGEYPSELSCVAAIDSVQQTQGPFHMPPAQAGVPVRGVTSCAAGHGLAQLLGPGDTGTSLPSWHFVAKLSLPPPLGSRPLGHIRQSPLGPHWLPLPTIWRLWQPGTILSTTCNRPHS